MKFRREFVVFGAVILIAVILVVVSVIFGGKTYKSYKVESPGQIANEPVSDSQSSVTEPVLPSIGSDGWIGDSGVSHSVRPSEDVSQSGDGSVEISSPPEVSTSVTDIDETGQDAVSGETGEPVVEDKSPDEGQGDGDGEILNEQLAYMVAYYICGLEHQLFDSCISQNLLSERGTLLSSEPYATLSGNTYFEDLILADGVVSFVAKDSVVYKFSVTFDGDVLTSLEYVS